MRILEELTNDIITNNDEVIPKGTKVIIIPSMNNMVTTIFNQIMREVQIFIKTGKKSSQWSKYKLKIVYSYPQKKPNKRYVDGCTHNNHVKLMIPLSTEDDSIISNIQKQLKPEIKRILQHIHGDNK